MRDGKRVMSALHIASVLKTHQIFVFLKATRKLTRKLTALQWLKKQHSCAKKPPCACEEIIHFEFFGSRLVFGQKMVDLCPILTSYFEALHIMNSEKITNKIQIPYKKVSSCYLLHGKVNKTPMTTNRYLYLFFGIEKP